MIMHGIKKLPLLLLWCVPYMPQLDMFPFAVDTPCNADKRMKDMQTNPQSKPTVP